MPKATKKVTLKDLMAEVKALRKGIKKLVARFDEPQNSPTVWPSEQPRADGGDHAPLSGGGVGHEAVPSSGGGVGHE
jgi:hypothetical protein